MDNTIDTKVLLKAIELAEANPQRKIFETAEKYYENENDILQRKRSYINSTGGTTEEKRLSNTKLAHAFLPEFVEQKIDYILSNPITIKSDDENYQSVLSTYFDDTLSRVLANLGVNAILGGIAWLHVFYDANGNLNLTPIDTRELTPFWSSQGVKRLIGMARKFTLLDENGKEKEYVDYYTANGVIHYSIESGKLVEVAQNGHLQIDTGDAVVDVDFGKVPFIPFRYNEREISLLQYIKPLLDDYDHITSDVSNDIRDTPNAFKVVRGYTAEPSKFVANMSLYRTVFVEEGGDVTSMETHIDTTATEAHLKRLREDLYDTARCVDIREIATGNLSGVAIKLRFARLDGDCTRLSRQFAASLQELLHFINFDITAKHLGNFEGSTAEFIFTRNAILNETDAITNCSASVGLLSQDTILANHPWCNDVKSEKERLLDEPTEEL